MALFFLALFSVFPRFIVLVQASFDISPAGSTIKQCSQVDLIFTETPPVHMWVAPNDDTKAGDPVLENLGVINDSFVLWTVNLPVGQVVSFTYVRIAQQTSVFSSPQSYTVVSGDTATCLSSTGTSNSSATTSTPQGTNTSIPSSSSTIISSGGTMPVASSTSGADERSSTRSSTGIIVGAAVGGAAILIALLGSMLFCIHRKRRQASAAGDVVVRSYSELDPPATHHPSLPRTSIHASQMSQHDFHAGSVSNLSPGNPFNQYSPLGRRSSQTNPDGNYGSSNGNLSVTRARARENDAGIILETSTEIEGSVSLPPAYEDVRRPSQPAGHHPMLSTDNSSATAQSGDSYGDPAYIRSNLLAEKLLRRQRRDVA